jgi:propionyl-CoA synthetase
MARTDDVINTAGHRISTGRIEEVVMEHQDVAECAVVGRDDTLKGEVPLAFVVLQNNKDQAKVTKELQNIVRDKVGAFAKLDNVVFI